MQAAAGLAGLLKAVEAEAGMPGGLLDADPLHPGAKPMVQLAWSTQETLATGMSVFGQAIR
jgi:hypothetical protein